MVYPKIFRYENVPILKARISIPFVNIEETDRLFDSIANCTIEFLSNSLYPQICKEYCECSEKSKKFHFGYFYDLTISQIFRSDEHLSVSIKAELKKRNDRSYHRSYDRHFVFRLSDNKIVPYEAFTTKSFRKKYRREGYCDYCIKENELCFWRQDGTETSYPFT